MWRILVNRYVLTFTEVIKTGEKDLRISGVKMRENKALNVKEFELINRNHVRGSWVLKGQ